MPVPLGSSDRPKRVPQEWGYLTLLEIGSDPVMAVNTLTGKQYDTGETGPAWWLLRCDCGHEWKIAAHTFPGKKLLRSCGRDECPYTNHPPPAPRNKNLGRPPIYAKGKQPVLKTLYVPPEVVLDIYTYGYQNQCKGGFSGAAVEVLKKGLMAAGVRQEQEQQEQQRKQDQTD